MASHIYLIDSRVLTDRRNEELLIEIEKKSVELGIHGPFVRLSPIKTAQDALSVRKEGIQTVIGVGSDDFFFELLDFVCDQPRTLGFIPVGGSRIGSLLGIPSGQQACATVAQRLVLNLDCGKINQRYFFTSVDIPASCSLFIDNKLRLQCDPDMFYQITNIDAETPDHQKGLLLVRILRQTKALWRSAIEERGRFFFTECRISGTGTESVVADGKKVFKTPVLVRVAPKSLRVIVGKQRHASLGALASV